MAAVVVQLGAVRGKHHVRQGDRDVVLALREQRAFHRIVQLILRGEPGIAVLRRVVHAVVVIPECPRTLEIRVLIALLLPGAVTSLA